MNNPYESPSADVSTTTRTVITDIDIPFGRLIVIMLKTMLASIPAVIVMYAIMGAIFLVLMLLFGGAALMSGLNPEALGK